MKLCKDDLLTKIFKFIPGTFNVYCPSEDMVDFLNVQGKLKPLTLRKWFLSSKKRQPHTHCAQIYTHVHTNKRDLSLY